MVRGKETRHVASNNLGNLYGSFSDAKKIIGKPSDSLSHLLLSITLEEILKTDPSLNVQGKRCPRVRHLCPGFSLLHPTSLFLNLQVIEYKDPLLE